MHSCALDAGGSEKTESFGYLVRLGSKSLRSPSPKLIRVLRNPSSIRIIC